MYYLRLLLSSLIIPYAFANPTLDPHLHRQLLLSGRPQIGLWKALLREQVPREASSSESTIDRQFQQPFQIIKPSPSIFEPHCFPQLISHFDDSVNGTFCQRYWVDASSYMPGGPVYLLDGGEINAEYRLPFLEKGILDILSNATGGLSIVLEHRYYGESVPVSSFSTDDLRFLNNAEALEDSANFIENFKLPSSLVNALPFELEETAFHPNNTPWIYYGGSYAGARAAHMRTQYPDLVWGAIASSAVTHAQIDFPQYYDPIQEYGPRECISTLQRAIIFIDNILDHPRATGFPQLLKRLFGLGALEDDDFADVISSPLGYWQEKNWDPAVGSTEFYNFCDALTAGGGGSKIGLIRVPASVLNYAKYIKENVVSKCPRSPGEPDSDIEDCFGTKDPEKFRETDLSQIWRLWLFQVCTQWGYFMPAPPFPSPRIISSRLTLAYTSAICPLAFPPGKNFSIPPEPDVEEVNRRGDFAIEADRLAFIDGDRDPWRPMTPQRNGVRGEKGGMDVNKPGWIIYDGVHHYDENGLAQHEAEPARIQAVHEWEKKFVSAWLEEWKIKQGTA
ncbi:serine carboxypeptidase [Cryptococcus bacillisporus CA1873]|uniref:Serine carboxypeptidase n=1 Tax=Cryptococcus bacillisporus CA1873 TaxID=1296111 RepID=A0ABR5BC44_CRYGA|nr:serine carboxypeptidase [Cryptococcus bacillisporus CA1873]|eukprot:KIR63875.1 serine carboxypeptidase [Cryptococcus gattii CA1873]